jgi:hypothetical protein
MRRLKRMIQDTAAMGQRAMAMLGVLKTALSY